MLCNNDPLLVQARCRFECQGDVLHEARLSTCRVLISVTKRLGVAVPLKLREVEDLRHSEFAMFSPHVVGP